MQSHGHYLGMNVVDKVQYSDSRDITIPLRRYGGLASYASVLHHHDIIPLSPMTLEGLSEGEVVTTITPVTSSAGT